MLTKTIIKAAADKGRPPQPLTCWCKVSCLTGHGLSSPLKAVLLCGLSFSIADSLSALDLVKEGKPAIVIVCDAQPEPRDFRPARRRKPKAGKAPGGEYQAARVLVEWIKKMTGAELPVVSQPPKDSTAILVGQAAIRAGLKLDDIPSPSREGLRILSDERRVLLAGQNETATVKAACRLLEELGCRYFMDGPLGEVYPRTNRLAVGRLTITEKPGLLMRNAKGPSWRNGLWKTWNGAGGVNFNHSHSWGRYIEPGLFQQHPEYFAMDATGRRKPGQWLCTANPQLREYFARRIVEHIRSGTQHPSLSPPDGRGYCQCPACRAQDDPQCLEPSSGAVSLSKRYADFFDAVARRVAKKCPDSVLSFYCYADYTQPPALGHKLSPNLCAVIAPIRYCRLHPIGDPHCPSRRQQAEMIEGWRQEAQRLGYYNYMYNLADATLPFFKFTACQQEFPYLAARGLQMMTMEVLSNWHIYGPHIYLGLRLAYDPQADAGAIMEDYWQKFYGPRAAPFMKDYWMGIDAAVMRLETHAGGFHGLREAYTPEFLRQCGDRLEKAAQAVRDDPVLAERVALHTEGWKSAVAMREIEDATAQGDFARAWQVYGQTIARLRTLAAKGWANREYATAYLERFLGKNLEAAARAAAPPGRVLQVLPDAWRLNEDPRDLGKAHGWHAESFDASQWPVVSAYARTLSSQGRSAATILWYRNTFAVPEGHQRLFLSFLEVDGLAEVFVNGQRMEPVADDQRTADGLARNRAFFEVDITAAVRPRENLLAVRVDNRKITDLFRGGILRPVALIARP